MLGSAKLKRVILLATLMLAVAAQAPSVSGRLIDPSDAPVPGIVLSLRGGSTLLRVVTGAEGLFRFDPVEPGSYTLTAEVPGFEPLRTTVRIGSRPIQTLALRLRLGSRREELTVAGNDRQVSVEAGANADAVSVERSMLDNLPVLDLNYLATLSRFLDPGSPGGAGTSLIVDGMESRNVGVTASAIQEIRINNNPYTAEYPRWSRRRIEVITKSSADRLHGTANFLFRDYHMNAREAFAAERPREQRRIFEGSLFGPVGSGKKASFLLSGSREEEDLVAVVFARDTRGLVRDNVPTPQVNSYVSGRITWQPNQRHAVFFQQNFQDRWQNNAGAGGSTPAGAAAQSRFREDEFIFNHRATITTNLLYQFRILIGRYWAPTKSNEALPRITVSDAFTGGGAQADRLTTEFHAAITGMFTQTIRGHTLKYGINVPDWSRRGLVDRTNQAGTWFYGSLADLAAQRPFARIVQQGDPKVIFIEKNVGGFFQDEWRIRKNLSVAFGARYDWQNYFGDANNIAPRLSMAWSPRTSSGLVLRAGAGLFSERSGPGPIYDILRYDGVRLRRYLLTGAAVGLTDLTAQPTSVHRLEANSRLPNILQFSAGFEKQLATKTTLAVNYVGVRGAQQLRSRDANAPLPPSFAARPNASLNALRVIEAAGRLESNSLEIAVRGNLAPKVTATVQYVLGRTRTNTGGLNWYPANSFDPAGEWGRADTDRLHQFNVLGVAALHPWASFGFSASVLSGIPFNITTGRDDNGDGMAIDRPVGVTRNIGRGPGLAQTDLRWYRDFRLQPAKKEKSATITMSVDAFNLLNRVNYQNFAGALTSPFFGRAMGTQPARRLQIGMRAQF